jgi:hypothetical protein
VLQFFTSKSSLELLSGGGVAGGGFRGVLGFHDPRTESAVVSGGVRGGAEDGGGEEPVVDVSYSFKGRAYNRVFRERRTFDYLTATEPPPSKSPTMTTTRNPSPTRPTTRPTTPMMSSIPTSTASTHFYSGVHESEDDSPSCCRVGLRQKE